MTNLHKFLKNVEFLKKKFIKLKKPLKILPVKPENNAWDHFAFKLFPVDFQVENIS